jgi:ComEC/Rec2-related protein
MLPTPPPALRLLILVIATMLAAGSVAPRMGPLAPLLFPLSAMALAAVGVWTARRGSWETARTLGGVGTGMLLGLSVSQSTLPAPHRYPPWVPARIEGVVTSVRDHPLRVQIRGELDRQDLPPISDANVVLRITSVDPIRAALTEGSSVVADAMVRRPTPFHVPTEPNEAAVLASLGAQWSATARASDVHPGIRVDRWHRWLGTARRTVNDAIRAVVDTSMAPIAMALITGDRSLISYDQRSAYAAAGTAHMLSVSGSHVALILAILLLVLARLRSSALRLAIAAVLICLYVVFTGAEPPAVRAAVMGIAAMSGRYGQRQIDGLNIWALTMLGMLCVQPSMISSVSFQLSAWATLGLIVLPPRLLAMCRRCALRRTRWKRTLAAAICIPVAANAAIAIPAALTFETVSLVSPLVNLVVVPLMSAGMVFTLLALACMMVLPVAAPLYGHCATWCLHAADIFTRGAATLRPDLDATAAVALAVVIAAGTWWVGGTLAWKHVLTRICVVMVGAAILVLFPPRGTVRTVATFVREDCIVHVYPLPQERTLVRIVGRRNDAAIRDIALHQFIATLSRPTVQRSSLYVSDRDHVRLHRPAAP